ncbi:nuclear transport factor 2 family protein [Nocardioides sp. IC4_145]|uniref:nuclear transport factor 2 family protein n=1 Tax=Nocardioides sp. IC4_145 TaxID=2714037 RepID=UPI00140C7CBC|nr:nuclear transport factor 2 family protein [Nocardioides sp. IC4_145]NHC23800.1 nuclear transport factor 2 family protein [Nocardioides sp. IC4_145]
MGERDDRAAIYELVCSYCRAVDRRDLDGVRAVYARDGVDHHTGFDGSADEYVAWLARMLPALDGTMHLVGNHLVELRGDEAVAETYGQAVHWGTPADEPASNFTTGFRYVDHLVREDGAWRIRERWAVREWTRSEAGRLTPGTGSGPRAARDGSDPLDVALGRLRGSGGFRDGR